MRPTNVYVDGFNLYYGALKGSPNRWLDLAAMCRNLFPKNSINRIRYFTAPVTQRPGDPQAPTRQQMYLRALDTIPHLSVHLGQFRTNNVALPLAKPPIIGSKYARVLKTEEKGSDVNLATYLLLDAFRKDCEVAIVITDDSDLKEPVRIVNDELGVIVGVVNPHNRKYKSAQLADVATFVKPMRQGMLAASQFPSSLQDEHGTIQKPSDW